MSLMGHHDDYWWSSRYLASKICEPRVKYIMNSMNSTFAKLKKMGLFLQTEINWDKGMKKCFIWDVTLVPELIGCLAKSPLKFECR